MQHNQERKRESKKRKGLLQGKKMNCKKKEMK